LIKERITKNMMKILTIILMVSGLLVFSAISNVSSDEGPTVIIVGSEKDKQKTVDEQGPENSDQYQIEAPNQEEEYPETIDEEVENPDEQYMEEYQQDDAEEPESE